MHNLGESIANNPGRAPRLIGDCRPADKEQVILWDGCSAAVPLSLPFCLGCPAAGSWLRITIAYPSIVKPWASGKTSRRPAICPSS